jgi:hypothetical protein
MTNELTSKAKSDEFIKPIAAHGRTEAYEFIKPLALHVLSDTASSDAITR